MPGIMGQETTQDHLTLFFTDSTSFTITSSDIAGYIAASAAPDKIADANIHFCNLLIEAAGSDYLAMELMQLTFDANGQNPNLIIFAG